MNLKDDMLNEITQTQKDKYFVIPLLSDASNRQIHRDRK